VIALAEGSKENAYEGRKNKRIRLPQVHSSRVGSRDDRPDVGADHDFVP
jgi:hypothetical protein